ncbi:hypothetical protein BAE44_0001622, partial [Dichanthelium oligosanthes]
VRDVESSREICWQREIQHVAVCGNKCACPVRVDNALEGNKPAETSDGEWKVMEWKAVSTIRLCLSDEVKYSVIKENSPKKLWKSFEELYMAKSLTNR